ncbi:branched-chain amino acid ABC transporter permease [Aquibacillus sp. 3ASR75-11]|uniref:Branched-chain amino acid ABC transporter permease n=1 Tax=Terrihalobacillus insolitus TaxID=2950438 RepID=A0A9X4AN18_9BACI|nr:branched-chain amino acid ABC transporter permease [Terrihalobacillus insolitus]MDC3413986.1 branched-chain amino acid ABC transporter permease [Terrihalobacillus insolitus]MDC3424075.1 branched-chain amino acid ABC transporter permease [Terrihalobacillus insolitus]
MELIGAQLVNAVAYGLLLFIITCGLTLVFGILGVLNLAHGSFYMFSAYIAYSITETYTQSFWLALFVAPMVVGLIALVVEITLLRPTYHLGQLSQVLLTFGLAYIFNDIAPVIWGSDVLSIKVPSVLSGSVTIFEQKFPVYRFAVIGIGIAIAILLWMVQNKTKWGAIIRAGLSDKEMVSALGINIKLVFTSVFIIGGVLAAFGGVVAAPILGIYPSMEFQTLILALVVLVIGGLGSVAGTLVASLLVGIVETFSRFLAPEISMFLIFGLMAVILVLKPNGLLGKKVV